MDDSTVAATVQAGQPLADLVQWAAAERLAGIECLAGIPDALDHLTAWDWALGRLRTLPAQACRLRHRDSRFKNDPGRWILLTATFHLTRSPAAPITHRPLADELGVRIGARPPVAEVATAVLTNRHRRGLLTAHDGATATGFSQALTELSTQVEIATGIKLRPEPTLVGTRAQGVP
ncbi:hypothetical protein ABT095_38700 [Kitasatospora sp. NPDC002227]|uniref:hypothetical protein n=1 Tax=Kitasatospora sp. NPDC002227 TaxID=3154773 RepID=UPI00332363F8